MNRRAFVGSVIAGAAALQTGGAAAAGAQRPRPRARIRALANDFTVVYESPDPARIYAYSPGLALLPTGRLVATMDQGGDVASLPGAKRGPWLLRGKIFTSDDRGRTWLHRTDTPMEHARPFVAGDAVYVLGHSGDLMIVRSTDGGDTWSEPVTLTQGQAWHQAPCNVHHTRGRVYLVMERHSELPFRGPAGLAPVMMSARVGDDLTRRAAWVFSNELGFREAMRRAGAPDVIGAPFYPTGAELPSARRHPDDIISELGWLETNIVRFTDPAHYWCDPSGRTFHLFMRSHSTTSDLGCIAKAVEAQDGSSIELGLASAPSGEPLLYLPWPGGYLKFHLLYDERTRLFWLLSNQGSDSMTRPENLSANRGDTPKNERHRLVLHFSKNCIDWCFAGLVATSGNAGQSRNYASMVIDGDDLYVLSRSGDARAKSAHDGNLITFHIVRGFRQLVY